MAKNAMPVSKAKTAYGLLSEIRKLILEEPKRYNQHAWRDHPPDNLAPACGTVCCVAGWVNVLKGNPDLTENDWHDREDRNMIAVNARDILGISDEASYQLFDGEAAGGRFNRSTGVTTSRELRAHAKRGAAHIERFQQKYAKQLKAKKV